MKKQFLAVALSLIVLFSVASAQVVVIEPKVSWEESDIVWKDAPDDIEKPKNIAAVTEYEALKPGDNSDDVADAQTRLRELNYLNESADGDYGSATSGAVSLFQADNGLKVTGECDIDTLKALYAFDAKPRVVSIKYSDKNEGVRRFQMKLKQLGLFDGDCDGQYGTLTQTVAQYLKPFLGSKGDEVDAQALERLYSGDFSLYGTDLETGSSSQDVLFLERRLGILNYFGLTADSTYDEYTAQCVSLFQSLNGLTQTGKADKATIDKIYSADPKISPIPALTALSKSDSGALPRAIEKRLSQMGYSSSSSSDEYDSSMASRLSVFLKAIGQTQPDSGETLDVNTIKSIFEITPDLPKSLSPTQRGDDVRRLQRRLVYLRYMGTPGVDGVYGEDTTIAVKDFQTANNIPANGIADDATIKALFSDDCVGYRSKYLLRVSIDDQCVYAYSLTGEDYSLIKCMPCSTGLGNRKKATPKGVFLKTGPYKRWHHFKEFRCWAQYSYAINGNVLFHSVLYYKPKQWAKNTWTETLLGRKASHGCVRLAVPHARWIYENCPSGTIVEVV